MSIDMKKYVAQIEKKFPEQSEFIQSVDDVLSSLGPVLDRHPEWVKDKIIERLLEPEHMVSFRVVWEDDNGEPQVNIGYRCQFNGALGPYKGGLRFAPNVYPGLIKGLAFEQIFKNSLTGLPIGGGKGGSDFNPNGKSDKEVMRFCQAFMAEANKHIGAEIDVPAGDQGVGGREIGYLFGQYRKITGKYEAGVLTGKGVETGGLAGRSEATGYGIVFFVQNMLKSQGDSLEGKTVVISGFGNVAWGTAQKLEQVGAKLIAFSGPDGYILDESGITGEKVEYMLELRASGEDICSPYAKKYPEAKFFPGEKPWGVKADIYIPCATQNDVHLEHAKQIVASGCKYYCEGANLPTTPDALEYLMKHGVIVGPAKAANAGGVACSAIEMSQNAQHAVFSKEDVFARLEEIMKNIHDSSAAAAEEYGYGYDLVAGANIAGFIRVAKAMQAQGWI
ncbi:MAG: NADP-specific glutamate dehydrogenase [Firmicutes bacterium]|nr:NADP-specific glutamate dehydrogenase [Bacillota bacterium]MBR0482200.1 NADP-specific glutamate dehydrogenase [Bacillota bacterium]